MTKPLFRLPTDARIRFLPDEPSSGFEMITHEEYQRRAEAYRTSVPVRPKTDVLVGHDVDTGRPVVFSERTSKAIRAAVEKHQ